MVLSKAQKAQRKRRRTERKSIENHKPKLAKENEPLTSTGSHVDLDLPSEDGLSQSYYEELEAAEDDRALMPFLESDVADSSDLDGCDEEEIMKAIWPDGSAHVRYTPKVVKKSKDDAEKAAKGRKPIKNPKPSTTAEPRRSNGGKIAIENKATEVVEKEDDTSRHRQFLDQIDLTLSSEDEDGVPRSYYEELKAIEDTRALMQFLESDIADSSDLDGCDEEELLKCIWPEGSAHFQYTPKLDSQTKDDEEGHVKYSKPIDNSKNPTDPRLLQPISETPKNGTKHKDDHANSNLIAKNPTNQNLSTRLKELKTLSESLEKPTKYLKPIRNPLNPNGKLIPAPISKQTQHHRKKEALKEMGSKTSMKMVANWCQVKKVNHHIDPILLQSSKESVTQTSVKRKKE